MTPLAELSFHAVISVPLRVRFSVLELSSHRHGGVAVAVGVKPKARHLLSRYASTKNL